jgi:hypothetical protein
MRTTGEECTYFARQAANGPKKFALGSFDVSREARLLEEAGLLVDCRNRQLFTRPVGL